MPILVLVSPFERFHNNAIYVFYLVFTLKINTVGLN